MIGWHNLSLVSVATLITLSLVAGCGGRSADDAGTGGSSNQAGSGGATPGQGGAPSSFGGSSAGGAFMGKGGAAQGGAPGEGCSYAGKSYGVGESFPASDGCNRCTCYGMNSVGCTLVDCPNSCDSIAGYYASTIEEAKWCDPSSDFDQCAALEPVGLRCPCPSFVNPAMVMARAQLAKWQSAYEAASCGSDIVCGACLEPRRGMCSPEGRCEDVFYGGGASCLVNGKLYPDGAGGIKDPFSCNTCSCSNGSLGCTTIGCQQTCPPNSAPGQRCAQCGPADGCDVIETGCLPLCADSCPSATDACVNGVCTARCG